MNDDLRYDVPAHVVARDVGGETILLDLEEGGYFGLDPLGARIWMGLSEGRAPAQIRADLLNDYDVSDDQLRGDMDALIGDLLEKGLLCPVESAP